MPAPSRPACHSHLVEQGLKEVVIRTVDECHVNGHFCQLTCHCEAPKTSTNDDDVTPELHVNRVARAQRSR